MSTTRKKISLIVNEIDETVPLLHGMRQSTEIRASSSELVGNGRSENQLRRSMKTPKPLYPYGTPYDPYQFSVKDLFKFGLHPVLTAPGYFNPEAKNRTAESRPVSATKTSDKRKIKIT